MKVTPAMRKAVYQEFAAAGGRARGKKLSAERRSAIAKKAAQARWRSSEEKPPRASDLPAAYASPAPGLRG